MNTRLTVSTSSVNGNKLILNIDETLSLSDAAQLKATGSMLVDSDNLALIYIVENDENFVYISLPMNIWPHLHVAVEKQYVVELVINTNENQKHSIELVNIIEELSYLKENIADNANYGEEMESKFSEVFLPL